MGAPRLKIQRFDTGEIQLFENTTLGKYNTLRPELDPQLIQLTRFLWDLNDLDIERFFFFYKSVSQEVLKLHNIVT